eukprot:g31709.t1
MAQAFRKRTRVVEALPPYDLAKSKLVNFDLFGELRRAHADEARRHYACLTTPNVGLVERKCPYGAPLPKRLGKNRVNGPSFDFDHLPQGQSSEARMQYFPRSTTIIRDIGCGKDWVYWAGGDVLHLLN